MVQSDPAGFQAQPLKVRQGIMRQMESRAFNLLIRVLFGLTFHDTQCGAKVFKKSAIDAVLPMMISRGFEFDVEPALETRGSGYVLDEVPIEWQNKRDSRVQKRDMIRMLSGLFYGQVWFLDDYDSRTA